VHKSLAVKEYVAKAKLQVGFEVGVGYWPLHDIAITNIVS